MVAVLLTIAALPSVADAHGPVAPIASSHMARPNQVPPGLEAKAIDGDQRMWLRAQPDRTVIVADYRGAPYVRFSPSGIDVNHNSEMYYLNQTPVAETPPSSLSASTPPSWHRVSGGHSYEWHDGRLHALATVALSPGATFAGRWRIPVAIDGRAAAISGGLYRAGDPSVVWFWPIVVLLACVLAAWRLRRPELDARLARALGIVALIAVAGAGAARQLHGRPTVGVFAIVELVVLLALVAWGLWRVLLANAGYFTYFAVAFFAIAEGLELVPTLLHGFVLAAVPAFVARTLSVVCLGTGIGLLPIAFRMATQAVGGEPVPEEDLEEGDDGAWELA
jgi:hypothetical protein